MIRIISPEGVTLAVQSAGSGTFKMADTDEERQYSTSTTMEYDQTAKSNVCTYWQQTTPFAKALTQLKFTRMVTWWEIPKCN